MKNLHVRNVPDDVYDALRKAADTEGRSLSSEVVAILKRSLGGLRVDRAAVLAEIDELERRVGRMPWSGAELVREDRDR
ncbi:MAG: Arc family DNA-binding protein [Actinomycetota bacterium]